MLDLTETIPWRPAVPLSDTAIAFLAQANIAIFSTVGPGNRPQALPIWYAYEDGEIVMMASARSQKVRNIKRNPEVALTVDQRTPPYYAAMVQGAAVIGEQPDDDLRLRIAIRYLGDELGRQYTARGTGEGVVTIRLRPRSIVEYKSPAREEVAGAG